MPKVLVPNHSAECRLGTNWAFVRHPKQRRVTIAISSQAIHCLLIANRTRLVPRDRLIALFVFTPSATIPPV